MILTMTARFSELLDTANAFDRVDYVKLFKLLVERKLPPVCLHLLLNLYTNHVTRVAWKLEWSPLKTFSVFIGVKQVEMICHVLFCSYLDWFLCKLSDAGVGHYIGKIFVGAFDIVLLAPTAKALRSTLDICDKFIREYSLMQKV